MKSKKRVAYPNLSRERALEKQREANRRYAQKNPQSSRRERDIARLGLDEYLRRSREKSARYYRRNAEKCRAQQRARWKQPGHRERFNTWRKAHRAAHVEAYRASKRAWHGANAGRINAVRRTAYLDADIRAKHKRWNSKSYLRHRERRMQSIIAWRAANVEKVREYSKRGTMKRRSLTPAGRYSAAAFYSRCEYFGWCCVYCSKPLNKKTVTIDHVIPLSKGGSNWPSNLVPACSHCNKTKHARRPSEWRT